MAKAKQDQAPKNTFNHKVVYAAILIYLGLFFCQKVQFVTADLGRFIQNGAVFFNEGSLLQSNHYSYTEPDYFFGNHHWGVGVLYYLVEKINGFKGLSVFNILLILGSVWLFMSSLFKNVKPGYIALAVILCIPLINWRIEIRPEFFSYILLGLYYFILWRFINSELSFKRTALIIFPVMLLWVNVHIFFVIGLSLLGAFWFCSLFLEKYKSHSRQLSILFGGSVLISLCNPGGIWGLLEPFMIFKEYGYMVAENQSVFFMQNRYLGDPKFWYMEAFLLLMFIAAIYFLYKKKQGAEIDDAFVIKCFLLLCFTIPAFAMIRFIPVLGLMSIPFAAHAMQLWENTETAFFKKDGLHIKAMGLALIMLFAGFFLPANGATRYWNPLYNKPNMGFGIQDGIERSAKVFKQLNIKGPILNNYDIGSYLIYYLYPENKVFVDNRPEAYSVDFFKKTYYPLHESEEAWKAIDAKYKFNAIYYFRHDNTEHGQPFLIRRTMRDPDWAPVYVDAWTIILLKRNEINKSIIDQHELPQSMFIKK